MKNRIILLTFYLGLLCIHTQALASKTDIIILKNGDHVTGEIKGLSAGQLQLSTEYMDTVYIDWVNIRDIISNQGQQIEMSDGRRLTGTLDKPQSGDPDGSKLILINTDEGQIEESSDNLVRMYPVGGEFWDRMDLIFSLGFNFDKNSSVGKYNFGIDATYRDPGFISFGRWSSEVTTQETVDTSNRHVLSIDHVKNRPNQRFLNYFGSMEQNDELGVQLRTLAGAGYGWVPIASSRSWMSLGAGLDINWERPLGGGDPDTSLEAVGQFRYQYFRRGTPERTLDIYFRVYPSITQWGRVRADFTADARWEIVKDFFIGMELYSSYDGEPAVSAAANIDYGYRTTVGLKF